MFVTRLLSFMGEYCMAVIQLVWTQHNIGFSLCSDISDVQGWGENCLAVPEIM